MKNHAAELANWIQWLSSFGRVETGGVTRLLYDKAWCQAQNALQGQMKKLGFTTYFDDVGNLFGRMNGRSNPSNSVLTGSHIDTVVNGGKFDGAYGVLASLLAVSRLIQRYGSPLRSIEVVSLCEEEGSRFPLSFWGSGNITGTYTLSDAANIVDSNGVSLVEAMHQAGFGKGDYLPALRQDIACFIETHIEQGQILELEKKSWAPVSHIVGQRRYTLTVTGESNHAGTTPMCLRKDALYASAKMITAIIDRANRLTNGLTATCGKIQGEPNVANVIAGRCLFTLDIRHHETAVLDEFSRNALHDCHKIAEQAGLALEINKWMDVNPVRLDPALTQCNLQLGQVAGVDCRTMVSGAGHDSQIFAVHCPTSLLFVPSHEGISHSPEEYTDSVSLEIGVQMLMRVLYQQAYTSSTKLEEQ
ncbi:MAG: allantoate deiminase [Sporolactobacillus sp.]